MELLLQFFDILLHVDKHLNGLFLEYGTWTYLILFLILFCETGLVVTPFLPGDSLLFAAGALSAGGALDPSLLFGLLTAAVICGDSTNYWIGRAVGPVIFEREKIRFINKKHLTRAHEFYEKHGGKTIFLARFAPILRTFAPFVAGVARMTYTHFLAYSVFGSITWIASFIFGGYFFGNLPLVKRNFSVVVAAIIVISLLPAAIEFLRHRKKQA